MRQQQILPPSDDKVYLAWVHPGTVHEGFARSMMEACLWQPNTIWGLVSASNPRQEEARNAAIGNFLDSVGDWLMWVDTDMTFGYDAIERLVQTAHKHEADMVAGLGFIFKRASGEVIPNGYLWDDGDLEFHEMGDYTKGDVHAIDGTGSGFVLIHRRVFEAFDDKHWHKTWTNHPETGSTMGHDLAFCRRATGYGFKIVWDTSVTTGHIKSFELAEETYDAYRASQT